MSGKAPPRGPRALLNSLQQSQTSSQQASSSKLPSTAPLPVGPKANVAPPTGPRSLMSGGGALGSRYGALNGGNNHKSPLTNGHTLARVPPSGPKGKAVDIPPTSTTAGAAASSSMWVNGKRPPTGPSALRTSATLKPPSARPPSPSAPPPPPPPPSERAPSHPPPPLQPYGHAPKPPPPPPASPPPIPPPPSDIPHLSAPIRLPTSQPQEPRLVPPPLPPQPAIPRPPSLAPPPLPPPLPPTHFLPTAPISIRFDPRSSRIHSQQRQTSKSSVLSSPSVLSPPPPPPPLPVSAPPPARPPSPPLPHYVVAVTELIDGKPKKFYSLKRPPHYPPDRSEFPEGRDFKVLYDGSCDKDRIVFSTGEAMSAKTLIDVIRGEGVADRIKETNKGKTHLIYRYLGETVEGEPRPMPSDPRKATGFRRMTRIREDFHSLTYEVCGHWFYSLTLWYDADYFPPLLSLIRCIARLKLSWSTTTDECLDNRSSSPHYQRTTTHTIWQIRFCSKF